MSTNIIDAQLCARMFLAGARNLEAKKDWINELNVFPVPDGDTGTNMTMTIMSAAKEVEGVADVSMEKIAKAMSSGSLRGARGNSGVILSQLLRGLCKVIKEKQELDTEVMVRAFQKATETAYKAVMKPKEGTILTVARGFSEKATELFAEDPEISLEFLIKGALDNAEAVLAQTPEMLPVLKEAGVVDSGGQGLVEILKGAYDVFMGKEVDYAAAAPAVAEQETTRYTYSCAFAIVLDGETKDKDIAGLPTYLEMIGDSVNVERKGSKLLVEVNTDEPGRVLTHALRMGTLDDIVITNLRSAAAPEEEEEPAGPRKDVGFVAVSIGEGLCNIFKDLGADYIIQGGQTMNPSTEDVLNAIGKVNADTVFVFPNNKNIILAAQQASELAENCKVIVVPTKTIPQGITALINYIPENSPEENYDSMLDEIGNVRTGQVTYAVRNTHIDDKDIHEGDYMGVGDKGIEAVGRDLNQTVLETIESMADEDSSLISVYYGADVTEEDAQALAEQITEKYDGMEVELNAGGQPVYYYILSVE